MPDLCDIGMLIGWGTAFSESSTIKTIYTNMARQESAGSRTYSTDTSYGSRASEEQNLPVDGQKHRIRKNVQMINI